MSQSQVRKKNDAYIYKNNFHALPADLCNGVVNQFGFYRDVILPDGTQKLEFVSICDPNAKLYYTMYDEDIKKLIKELVPEPEENKSGPLESIYMSSNITKGPGSTDHP